MKTLRVLTFILLIVLYGVPLTTRAQEAQIFSLPQGSVGKIYRASIEAVLRDSGMRLQSETRTPVFRWTLAGGELPPGLVLRPNGTIIGTPRVPRETPYQFKLKVSDAVASMNLEFNLTINASQVKLVPVARLKLVSEDEPASSATQGDAPKNHRLNPAPLPLLTSGITFESSSANVSAAAPSSQTSFTKEPKIESVETSDYSSTKTSGEPVSAPPAADCSKLCAPTPAPDENKDFIIDASSGTTRGPTRFKKRDRTRIIIDNKNPFLYDYRITVEDHPVEELALAAFLKLLPIGEGSFEKPKEPDAKAQQKRNERRARTANACPELDSLLLFEADLSKSLKDVIAPKLKTLTTGFNATNAAYEQSNAVLTSPTVHCPQLCTEADTLQSNLNNYLTTTKGDVDSLEDLLSTFKDRANSLKTTAQFVSNNSADCAQAVADARLLELADFYIGAGTKAQSKLDELIKGRKVFADTAKNITTILSTENAFFSVYQKGDFDGPTNVSVKVETKNKLKADSEFVSLIDTKINFGGGPRFALAGGFVFSNLEKPEYERVPAVINGATEHIVGLKENSNTRILPILMLHARLFSSPKWNYVSGIHFSLGFTAKPDNEGTDPEFLVGPSISFIEERLFFTFGGYAGRKQELEGNLTVGQKIPTDFGDELPISKHYVWKPGFAITYKIK